MATPTLSFEDELACYESHQASSRTKYQLDLIDSALQCPVCKEALKDAVMLLDCGHNFCKPCVGNQPSDCPECRAHVYGVAPSWIARQILSSAERKCVHCEETYKGEWHACPNSFVCSLCKLVVKDTEKDVHVSSVCAGRQVYCDGCNRSVVASELKHHIARDCSGYELCCSSCGKVNKKILEQHRRTTETCQKRIKTCACGIEYSIDKRNKNSIVHFRTCTFWTECIHCTVWVERNGPHTCEKNPTPCRLCGISYSQRLLNLHQKWNCPNTSIDDDTVVIGKCNLKLRLVDLSPSTFADYSWLAATIYHMTCATNLECGTQARQPCPSCKCSSCQFDCHRNCPDGSRCKTSAPYYSCKREGVRCSCPTRTTCAHASFPNPWQYVQFQNAFFWGRTDAQDLVLICSCPHCRDKNSATSGGGRMTFKSMKQTGTSTSLCYNFSSIAVTPCGDDNAWSFDVKGLLKLELPSGFFQTVNDLLYVDKVKKASLTEARILATDSKEKKHQERERAVSRVFAKRNVS